MRRLATVAIVSAAIIALAASWSWAGTATGTGALQPSLRIPPVQLQSLAQSLRHLSAPGGRVLPRLAAGAATCFVAARGGCSLTPCVYEASSPAALTLLSLPATPGATCRRPSPIQISTSALSAVPAGQPRAARATK